MTPPLRPEDVEKLAVGQKEAKDLAFSTLETILSEIIVGDAFGVDRIDYLCATPITRVLPTAGSTTSPDRYTSDPAFRRRRIGPARRLESKKEVCTQRRPCCWLDIICILKFIFTLCVEFTTSI